ncbi:hypothetical protein MTR67_019984 [Solanum verrucosum]|uniref:PPM-type phosphatase domain-containing protein n=1 Tax=Solanum verrucosum TaxID=315347 RepID=A0AAF0QV93_SOLVR|nr:hypothetical protein MTR67_019984 [Solanum verrucosum]
MLLFWPTIVDGRMICLHRGLTVPIQGLAVDKYLNRKMFEMLKYFRSPWIHAVFFLAHLVLLIWLFYSDMEEEIDGVEFLIVASDGLWNVLSNEEAVTLVQDIKDAEAASRRLIEEAYSRGSSDNITCVVVRFESA